MRVVSPFTTRAQLSRWNRLSNRVELFLSRVRNTKKKKREQILSIMRDLFPFKNLSRSCLSLVPFFLICQALVSFFEETRLLFPRVHTTKLKITLKLMHHHHHLFIIRLTTTTTTTRTTTKRTKTTTTSSLETQTTMTTTTTTIKTLNTLNLLLLLLLLTMLFSEDHKNHHRIQSEESLDRLLLTRHRRHHQMKKKM